MNPRVRQLLRPRCNNISHSVVHSHYGSINNIDPFTLPLLLSDRHRLAHPNGTSHAPQALALPPQHWHRFRNRDLPPHLRLLHILPGCPIRPHRIMAPLAPPHSLPPPPHHRQTPHPRHRHPKRPNQLPHSDALQCPPRAFPRRSATQIRGAIPNGTQEAARALRL